MVRVEGIRSMKPGSNGINHAVLDLQVSTSAELPSLGGLVEGMVIRAGSIAQVIQDGEWMTLDDNGTWYSNTPGGD